MKTESRNQEKKTRENGKEEGKKKRDTRRGWVGRGRDKKKDRLAKPQPKNLRTDYQHPEYEARYAHVRLLGAGPKEPKNGKVGIIYVELNYPIRSVARHPACQFSVSIAPTKAGGNGKQGIASMRSRVRSTCKHSLR